MRNKRVMTAFLLTMAFGAAAALPAGAQENSEVFHAKLTTNVYGDGQKPWYVSVEYDQPVDPESVSAEDFTVEGYEIVAVYTNTEDTIPDTSVAGNYVLLELSTDYTTTGYGGTGAGENGETVMGRPGNGEDRPETMEEMPEGEFQGDSGERMNGEANDDTQRNALPGNREGDRMGGMSFGEPSNQLTVTVTQMGEILTENGDVYAPSDTGVTTDYTENENLLVENFQQLTYSCSDGTEMMYNLFLPEGYEESSSYPLVLFMPDATGEGSDEYKTLTESLGGVIWSEQEWQENHPCIVLAPQYEDSNSSDPSYTMELLNEVENGYNVDTERIYLVGQSSGTIRSIKLFIDYPDTFAGGILVAGQADTASETAVLPYIDMTNWEYNEQDHVYWQTGISYCAAPADAEYETMGVYVPGEYFHAEDNGDGTYTCSLNTEGNVEGYTAETAPVVMPVNTPGYAAMNPPESYDSNMGYGEISDYTDAGFILVFAGARGRDAGAPAGVTDFKAAIRYTRYNEGIIPGNMDEFYVEGMSGGGAQAAVIGASGDSSLYEEYLKEIGAVEGVSDAVTGAMCWCPITSLDSADMAYEWNMGNTRTDLSEEEQTISDLLTEAYASYINETGFTDEEGNVLTLEQSEDGRYQAGTYYDYVKSVVEESLNHFLSDTTFPYDADASSGNRGGGRNGGERNGGGRGDFEGGMIPNNKDNMDDTDKAPLNLEEIDQIARMETASGVTLSGKYDTPQDYIDALNADREWISYDADTNTAVITSLADFAEMVKPASKGLGAFDELDAGQGENTLFGYNDGEGAHFDEVLGSILSDIGSEYASDYTEDLQKTDGEENSVSTRLAMYSPLYYLLDSDEDTGEAESTAAKYWRIRTGAWQSDTSITTEINLVLALKNSDMVESVDFETVWGMKHTEAERTGNHVENFIAWVNECVSI